MMRRDRRAVNEMEFRMRPPGRKECRRSVNLRAWQVLIAPIDVDSRSSPGSRSSAANSPAKPTRLVSEHGDLYYPQRRPRAKIRVDCSCRGATNDTLFQGSLKCVAFFCF